MSCCDNLCACDDQATPPLVGECESVIMPCVHDHLDELVADCNTANIAVSATVAPSEGAQGISVPSATGINATAALEGRFTYKPEIGDPVVSAWETLPHTWGEQPCGSMAIEWTFEIRAKDNPNTTTAQITIPTAVGSGCPEQTATGVVVVCEPNPLVVVDGKLSVDLSLIPTIKGDPGPPGPAGKDGADGQNPACADLAGPGLTCTPDAKLTPDIYTPAEGERPNTFTIVDGKVYVPQGDGGTGADVQITGTNGVAVTATGDQAFTVGLDCSQPLPEPCRTQLKGDPGPQGPAGQDASVILADCVKGTDAIAVTFFGNNVGGQMNVLARVDTALNPGTSVTVQFKDNAPVAIVSAGNAVLLDTATCSDNTWTIATWITGDTSTRVSGTLTEASCTAEPVTLMIAACAPNPLVMVDGKLTVDPSLFPAGPAGPKGDTGDTGATGPQGPAGKDADPCAIADGATLECANGKLQVRVPDCADGSPDDVIVVIEAGPAGGVPAVIAGVSNWEDFPSPRTFDVEVRQSGGTWKTLSRVAAEMVSIPWTGTCPSESTGEARLASDRDQVVTVAFSINDLCNASATHFPPLTHCGTRNGLRVTPAGLVADPVCEPDGETVTCADGVLSVRAEGLVSQPCTSATSYTVIVTTAPDPLNPGQATVFATLNPGLANGLQARLSTGQWVTLDPVGATTLGTVACGTSVTAEARMRDRETTTVAGTIAVSSGCTTTAPAVLTVLDCDPNPLVVVDGKLTIDPSLIPGLPVSVPVVRNDLFAAAAGWAVEQQWAAMVGDQVWFRARFRRTGGELNANQYGGITDVLMGTITDPTWRPPAPAYNSSNTTYGYGDHVIYSDTGGAWINGFNANARMASTAASPVASDWYDIHDSWPVRSLFSASQLAVADTMSAQMRAAVASGSTAPPPPLVDIGVIL